PRSHWPVVAVSLPFGLVTQPRLASKSSVKTVDPGGGVEPPLSTKSSRFGDPLPALPTTPVVASATILSRTCAGDQVGLADRIRAATPATCGAAIDVPLIVLVAVLEVDHAEGILGPGPKLSRQEPKFETDARLSLLAVAPTVLAPPARVGEKLHALAWLFPAALA